MRTTTDHQIETVDGVSIAGAPRVGDALRGAAGS